MRKVILSLLILVFATILSKSYAEEPRPFGLILGQTKKDEAIEILQKEGGRMTELGYKIIKGDIVNKDVEGIEFKGLPVDNLERATLWFYKGILYGVNYKFYGKEDFDVVFKRLQAKYGKPIQYKKSFFSDGGARWKLKDIEVNLYYWGFDLNVDYIHIPLFNKVEISDKEVLEKETNKLQKGL